MWKLRPTRNRLLLGMQTARAKARPDGRSIHHEVCTVWPLGATDHLGMEGEVSPPGIWNFSFYAQSFALLGLNQDKPAKCHLVSVASTWRAPAVGVIGKDGASNAS